MSCGILTRDVLESAGIEQGEEMKRFLWDNHFAAIASDMPSLERWPTPEGVPVRMRSMPTTISNSPMKIGTMWVPSSRTPPP